MMGADKKNEKIHALKCISFVLIIHQWFPNAYEGIVKSGLARIVCPKESLCRVSVYKHLGWVKKMMLQIGSLL